jgi:hypothetical protein
MFMAISQIVGPCGLVISGNGSKFASFIRLISNPRHAHRLLLHGTGIPPPYYLK